MQLSSQPLITPLQKQLLEGCLCGDRNCQLQLYNMFSSKMFSVCLRYAHDYHEAEDYLQEGFIRVFKNLKQYNHTGVFEGWIRRIFVNTAIEHYRKNNPLFCVSDVVPGRFGSINESALQHLIADDLIEMIQRLSPGYRTVFNLYAIEGYSHKEIGELLNINEGTSKSQLARARILLQKMLVAEQKNLAVVYVENL